jgi:aspartate/methionine/tyrosine aminotransferase
MAANRESLNLAPYMAWAKSRPVPRFDLAGSNVLACSIEDLAGAPDALDLSGRNDEGYEPLLNAIAREYGVRPEQVTTGQGTSGANFQVCAALLDPGDDVLVERPGYDPLLGAPRLLGARAARFDRACEDGYVLDPDRVKAAMTPRTKLIVVTSAHNPTGVVADRASLQAIGEIAAGSGAYVLVDEVYLDTIENEPSPALPAALLGDVFISSNSLTKSYGLASLRCGWTLSSPAVAERIRRARDVIDGTGSIVSERLSVLAFEQIARLRERARTLLNANRALVRAFIGECAMLDCVLSAGGTVIFPRIKGVEDAGPFVGRLLSERQTAVVPGRFFDAPAHFRLGFGGAEETVRGGLDALKAALAARDW